MRNRSDGALLPPLRVIEVIHTTSRGVSLNSQRGILSVVTAPKADVIDRPKKRPKRISVLITFSEADLEGASQPYDDTLVVTAQVGQFLVKRVMVD